MATRLSGLQSRLWREMIQDDLSGLNPRCIAGEMRSLAFVRDDGELEVAPAGVALSASKVQAVVYGSAGYERTPISDARWIVLKCFEEGHISEPRLDRHLLLLGHEIEYDPPAFWLVGNPRRAILDSILDEYTPTHRPRGAGQKRIEAGIDKALHRVLLSIDDPEVVIKLGEAALDRISYSAAGDPAHPRRSRSGRRGRAVDGES